MATLGGVVPRRSSLGTVRGATGQTGARLRGRVQVLGVPQAIRKLRLVGSVAGRTAGLIVRQSGFGIRDTAKEIVHSKTNPWEGAEDYEYTSNLKDGIELTGLGGRAGVLGAYTQLVTASSRAGGSDREYAAFEELGTSQAPAHPYLRPAVQRQVPKTQAMLGALASRLERL